MLRLDVHDLLAEPTGATLGFRIDEEQQELADDMTVSLLEGEAQLLRTDYGLFVQGKVHVQLQLQCVRCLTLFPYSLTVHLAERFAHNPQGMAQDQAPVFPISGGETIDLAPPLREHILLDIPLKPLCRPDCRGLCSQCGANLNETQCTCSQQEEIDPRLAALKELL